MFTFVVVVAVFFSLSRLKSHWVINWGHWRLICSGRLPLVVSVILTFKSWKIYVSYQGQNLQFPQSITFARRNMYVPLVVPNEWFETDPQFLTSFCRIEFVIKRRNSRGCSSWPLSSFWRSKNRIKNYQISYVMIISQTASLVQVKLLPSNWTSIAILTFDLGPL